MSTKTIQNLQINQDRLWDSLMEMAKIGATEKGGCARLALTDLDKQGRDLFVQWCKEAGCTITVDRMGNIFARRPGRNNDLPPVVTGSHLDTQPTGGKFDGVFGVLAGLEVIRTLNDYKFETEAPIEVSVWTNEEGSRFAPAMIASGVFGGVFTEEYGHSRADLDGKTIGEELKRIGYFGDAPVGGRPFKAFFEAHIEQGPILEAEDKIIGVVQGIQGIKWFEVTLTGQDCHAGTTPMNRRKDAMLAAARMVDLVNKIALDHLPGVGTVGLMTVHPNSRNVIPGKVFFTVDLRHPYDEELEKMKAALDAGAAKICGNLDVEYDLQEIWNSPAIHYDPACIDAVRKAADEAGLPNRDIVSGAGHDAGYIARVAPVGMIFVPCAEGISHNEIESALPEDLAAGCNVLMRAMVELAA
ncbi:hydantoinase/carbamoylase family amidase [Parvibaculum sedimenti]|uniref:Hydantoinase/carbamoylase family amidase n=1 Tax=Parvibaculum sedimenti TaxID=2608632 RepID=A0A6N6VLU9_9HYPH|nr:Zn-dependent hydrolase [Parvibaculum sedimenti]KAB7741707.1 hydantoinase/carbamoylase family amidase [Parvibaculum sedimenti]